MSSGTLEAIMEPPNKRGKRASRSSGGQISITDDLPDHVVHNILKSFTIKDLARFSTVSKSCRKLCFSVPGLHINLKDNGILLSERGKMFDFIDRFMIHREGSKLQSFNLKWDFQMDPKTNLFNEEYRVNSWLIQVGRCNVEKLNLYICFKETNTNFAWQTKKSFALPSILTTSTSLKYLSLTLVNCIFKLPTTGFSFLEELILFDAQIQQDLFEKTLVSCNSLKKLYVCNLEGIKTLNIKSICLEKLMIISNSDRDTLVLSTIIVSACRLSMLRVFWTSPRCKTLRVSALNVTYLSLDGDSSCNYELCTFSSLQTASIFAHTNPALLTNTKTSVDARRYYDTILQHVRYAKNLYINIGFVKLLPIGVIPATLLQNLHYLYLHVTPDSKGYDVPLIVSFLNSLSNLQHLNFISHFESASPINTRMTNSIMKAPSCSVDSEDLLASASDTLKILDKLKLVEIEIRGGNSRNALNLIEYLLKQASVLHKLTIYYPPEEYCQLSRISSSVESFCKASSTAAVYLLPRARMLIAKHRDFFYIPF